MKFVISPMNTHTVGDEYIIDNQRFHLTEQAVNICKCMNGKTPDSLLIKQFKKYYAMPVSKRDFDVFISKLRRLKFISRCANNCLTSKISNNYILHQEARFEKSKTREPSYAGLCYSKDPKILRKDMETIFSSINNRSLSKKLKHIRPIKAMVVPHSNIYISGHCAALAYKALAIKGLPEIIILLSPDHSFALRFPYSVLQINFKSPLGIVRVDNEFCNILSKNMTGFDIFSDNKYHIREHAIELQIPFIQHIYSAEKKIGNLRIVPILCSFCPVNDYARNKFTVYQNEFVEALKKTIRKIEKKVIIIATGDLMHNSELGHDGVFHKKNREIMSLLKACDAEVFRKAIYKSGYSTCGKESFYTLLRLIDDPKSKVLDYSWTNKRSLLGINTQSIEVSENIGYVSMIYY